MSIEQSDVKITLTSDEALVLFDFLQRFSETEKLEITDQAEERALWNLCCLLEKELSFPFSDSYNTELTNARNNLRDNL